MRAAEAAALGLLHGPAELLPVSSSGHVALARAVAGWEVDKTGEVALHAGAAAALLVGLRAEVRDALRARRVGLHVLAGAPPALAGWALERRIEALLGGPRAVAAGMLAGAAALAWADRAPQTRTRRAAGPADGLALGIAQAAALWPGISRNGATLAVARRRGFDRGEANRLSREVGLPIIAGAAAFKAWRRVRGPRACEGRERKAGERGEPLAGVAPLAIAAAASFASTLVGLPLLRLVDSGRPLWPFAAYRGAVALALLGRSGR